LLVIISLKCLKKLELVLELERREEDLAEAVVTEVAVREAAVAVVVAEVVGETKIRTSGFL